MENIKPESPAAGNDTQAETSEVREKVARPSQPSAETSSRLPSVYQPTSVFGVLPVANAGGTVRTGVSFKLASGEIVWLDLSCSDASTLRDWMRKHEESEAQPEIAPPTEGENSGQ